MLYPTLNSINSQRLWTEEFLGLDRRPRTYDGAFEAMGNMTGEPWPLLSSRGKRGVVAELEKPLGLMALGKLCWIDGTTLFFDGRPTGINQLSLAESMLPKRMAAMGSYILIWPDKVYYNTLDPNDCGSLDRLYKTEEGQSVKYTLCDMDGIDYPRGSMTASVDAPSDPAEGDYWLNLAVTPHALYQWGGQQNSWVGISSVYVRISAPGIGHGLKRMDSVTVSGIQYGGTDQNLKEQIEFLNATHLVQAAEENFIVVIGVIDQNYTQKTGQVQANRTAPDLDFIVESNNRLWGCRYGEEKETGEFVNRIYACALGDFRNWARFAGSSTDSYYVNVGTDGPFTGAVVHRGNPWFFKEDCVHRIFGEIPSNFQAQVTLCDGVMAGSENTLTPYNGSVFYLGRHGPQIFESLPQPVGKALGERKLSLGAAGQAGGVYYLSVQEEGGGWSLYTLNTERGAWHRQDDTHAIAFAELDGEMYMLSASGALYAMTGQAGEKEPEDVTWYAETGIMGYEYPDHKYLSRFVLRMQLGETAECHLSIQYDSDGIWRPKGTIRGNAASSHTGQIPLKDKSFGVKTYLMPIVPRRCEHMQLRIEGHGDMRLYGIARELSMGSDGR